MTTLAEVRDGLEARLGTIDGLRVYDHVPDNAFYPAAVIFPPVNADYTDDLGMGGYTVRMIVLLLTAANVDRKQLDLYALLDRTGPSSVFAAVEDDRTLGGLNIDCRVVSAADPLEVGEMAGASVYQRAITVEALIS